MDNINELNVNSFYDYLVYSLDHVNEYKLVIVITNKQVIMSTKKRNNDDHWNMIVDINKMIYPNREYNEDKISNDTFIITSLGNDLEIEIPDKVGEKQLQEVKNILRQVRQFEYEYDTYLYMPYNTNEIIDESNRKLSEEIENDEDEVIIGNTINNKTRK